MLYIPADAESGSGSGSSSSSGRRRKRKGVAPRKRSPAEREARLKRAEQKRWERQESEIQQMIEESGDPNPFGCLIGFLVLWGATAFFAWGYDENLAIGRIPLVLVPFKLLSMIPWPLWLAVAVGLAVFPFFLGPGDEPPRRQRRRQERRKRRKRRPPDDSL